MRAFNYFDDYVIYRNTGLSLFYPLIYSLVNGLQASLVFEFGVGMSTFVILDALELVKGKLITCGTDPKVKVVEKWAKPVNLEAWTHHHMHSDEALTLLKEDMLFDFVLHDGSHTEDVVEKDLKSIIPHMKQHSILAVHDSLHSLSGEAIRNAINKALENVKHCKLTLPYGFGLTLIRIDEDRNPPITIGESKFGSSNFTDLKNLM